MGNKETKNIKNESPLLHDAIEDNLVSKPWIAKKVYRDEWSDDEANQKKLTVRLRNKLNGNGSVSLNEIKAIEDALLEYAEGIRKQVEKSKAERSKRLKRKVKVILEHLTDTDRNDLLK